MGRLTWEKENGDWGLVGVEWKDVPHELYRFFCKLHDYEKLGLSPSEVKNIVEMSMAEKA